MRIKRKLIILCYFAFFFIFIPISYYLIKLLTSENHQKIKKVTKLVDTTQKPNLLEESIRNNVKSLPQKYQQTQVEFDNLTELFINNVNKVNSIKNLKQVWSSIKNNIRDNKLFVSNGTYLGTALEGLRTASIISADVDSRGTQLKLLLMLEVSMN